MNVRGLLAVLSMAAAPTASFATVVFQNTGTTSGWDYLSTQNKGTLTQVTSPVYKGTTAVRAMELGAESFLTKPVDMNHLGAVIVRVAEKVRLSRENSRLRALLEQPDLRQRAPTDRRYQAQSLSDVERQHIERTLRHHGGNRTRAALELGISRATLINKIKAYSLNL